MIRTNLSTRPFYNTRAVQTAIAALALLAAVVTGWNVVRFVQLTTSQRTLGGQAQQAETDAARLRTDAAQIRARIDPKELAIVAEAAREANEIIDRRAFSWTHLFTQFESTLPPDVRITSVTPRPRDEIVTIGVESRSVEDLNAFIEALEATGSFRDVLAIDETVMDDDTIQARLEAGYDRVGRRAGGAQ